MFALLQSFHLLSFLEDNQEEKKLTADEIIRVL